jgi:hypothetical protein
MVSHVMTVYVVSPADQPNNRVQEIGNMCDEGKEALFS